MWKNNWEMFENKEKKSKKNVEVKPRFKIKQKLIDNFRKIVGDSTIQRKLMSYKDI